MAEDDLQEFVNACREFDQQISIRGSTAYVLSSKAGDDLIIEGTIVGSVPPLGDLDLLVRDEDTTEAMQKISKVLQTL